jgi:hypothetical protein
VKMTAIAAPTKTASALTDADTSWTANDSATTAIAQGGPNRLPVARSIACGRREAIEMELAG